MVATSNQAEQRNKALFMRVYNGGILVCRGHLDGSLPILGEGSRDFVPDVSYRVVGSCFHLSHAYVAGVSGG